MHSNECCWLQAVERELSKLDAAMQQMQVYVDSLAQQNMDLRPLVDNATLHSYKLLQQANALDA